MLENRAFDHLLGFSQITGKDITLGVVRPIIGAAGSNVFQGSPIPPTTEADFKLSAPDVDPGHEFANTLVALCGDGRSYPAGGGRLSADRQQRLHRELRGQQGYARQPAKHHEMLFAQARSDHHGACTGIRAL